MRKASVVFLAVAVYFSASATFAADRVIVTFYAPGASGWMQGPMTASVQGPDGSNIIRTLDDVRHGRSKYVTLASAAVMRGRWYCLGTVKYASPEDRQIHTLENVVGYIHDTGCAFNGTCSCAKLAQFCNGQAHPEKMDVPVGNFSGWDALPAAQFVSRNPNSAASAWQQIAGLPTNSNGPCGGEPREMGLPSTAPYAPTTTLDPYSHVYNPYMSSINPSIAGQAAAYSTNNTGFPINNTGFPLGGTSAQQNGFSNGNAQSAPYSPNTSDPVQGGTSVANILVWPEKAARGATLNVIWTSVNMAKNSCQVMFDGQEFAKANEGVKAFKTVSSDDSSLTFTLRCQDANGQIKELSDSASLQ